MHRQDFIAGSKSMAGKITFEGHSEVQEITVTGDQAICWTHLEIISHPASRRRTSKTRRQHPLRPSSRPRRPMAHLARRQHARHRRLKPEPHPRPQNRNIKISKPQQRRQSSKQSRGRHRRTPSEHHTTQRPEKVIRRNQICVLIDITPAGTVLELQPKRDPMMTSLRPEFYPHRRKLDGSFDSICLNCLATIATSTDETELEAREKEHVCSKYLSRRSREDSSPSVLDQIASPVSPLRHATT